MPVGANAGVANLNVVVGVDLSQFNAGMSQVESKGAQVASGLSRLTSSLSTGAAMGAGFAVASTAISAMAGSVKVATDAVIGLNSQLEQARIGFTAFTGSAEKANIFVKQLQTFAQSTAFEFPGLLQAARQLTGMGVQAELVIPILKDVSAVVQSIGGGETEIKRVNLALTQMLAAGKVNAQDMNQLAQAGVPAWKMLADSMGKSIGEVRELSKEGKITAQQLFAAFHDFVQKNDLSGMAEKMNQTWQVSISNIIDGLRNMGAEGFEPLFNVLSKMAAALSDVFKTDQAAQFTADLKATVQDIVNSLQPIGDSMSRAFEAFKSGGVSAAFNSILTDAQNLAKSMLGAGYDVISEFAQGIMQGAGSVIEQAANFVAEVIASYLIGNSPPPVGPLSDIAKGGTAVIEAYVEGMKGGLQGVVDVAQGVSDALGNVTRTMTLTQAQDMFKGAIDNIEALKAGINDVESVIRNLDDQIRENTNTTRDYQNAAEDIKTAYDAAIDPLQKQVDALKEANDLATKQADIQDRIRLAQLKGALQQAQGDPVKRAQLQNQLDTLEQQEKSISLEESRLRLQQQQADLADKAAGKKPDNKDNTQTQQQLNALAQRRLGLQQQQNAIQQQMDGLVDKEAVARIKGQQAQVEAVKNQRDINQEINNLNRELQAAPLEQQIKDLKAQEQGLLQPIQERIREYEREGQALQAQRQQWTGLKQDMMEAMQQLREHTKAQEDAAKKAALANPTDLSTIWKPEAIQETAAKVGESWVKGFTDKVSNMMPTLLGGAVGALIGANMFGPIGAIAGAAFGVDFVKAIEAKVPNIGTILGDAFRTASQALKGDWKPPEADEWVNPFVEAIGKAFSEIGDIIRRAQGGDIGGAILQALGDAATLAGKLAGWIGDAVKQIPWADVWKVTVDVTSTMATWFADAATKFAGWIGDQVSQIPWATVWGRAVDVVSTMVSWFASLASFLATWIGDQVSQIKWAEVWARVTDAVSDMAQWFVNVATQFTTWIGDQVSQIKWNEVWAATQEEATAFWVGVTDVGSRFQAWVTPQLGEIKWAEVWGAALPSITSGIEVVVENMTRDLIAGIRAIPAQDLGKALVDALAAAWVTTRETLAAIIVGAIRGGIADLPRAIADLIAGVLIGAVKEMWSQLTAAISGSDIGKMLGPALNEAGKKIGEGVALGIQQGTPEAQAAMRDGLVKDIIAAFTSALGIHSPSTVFQQFGTDTVQGFADGTTAATPTAVASMDALTLALLTSSQTGWQAIIADVDVEMLLVISGIDQRAPEAVSSYEKMMADMLTASTTGWSAIHTATTQQLDEIWALINQKAVDMVGAVTNMETQMLAVFTSATDQWKAAGTALGVAFGEGLNGAMSNAMKMMSTTTGAVTGGSKASPQLQAAINAAASKYGLPANLFTAQLQHESAGFDPRVLTGERKGGSGEIGIGQFMVPTLIPRLQAMGKSIDDYLKDVNLQIEVAAKYMSELVQTYGDYDKALQAYNGGPGGVGTSATVMYSNIVNQLASTLQTNKQNMTMMSASAGMNLGISQITAGKNAGLSAAEAAAACGPYAAVLFSQAVGRNPTLAEATQLARAVGWTPQRGMAGTQSEMALLSNMGLRAVQQAATPENINAALAAGHPIALSTPKHYFVASGGTADALNVGATGTVMGGQAVMSLQQIQALGGGINDLIVLMGTLDNAGKTTFTNLTQVSGQYGPAVAEDTQQANNLSTANQTLAQSLAQGVVPAGLAARDAVGQMSLGIQPLIAQFANGQITSDELGRSIVQLAADTGLTAEPLQQLQQGNADVDEALRRVLTSLAAADPAFAQIQDAMGQTDRSTGQLADTLLQGLANVTGDMPAAFTQMAASMQPLQQAFANGAISGDDFVQGVVQLAATTGLTQQPLRMMQDGVLSANQALAAVVQQVSNLDPAMASMGQSIADQAQPATDAAKAFLDWVASMAQTQQAAQDANAAVQTIPTAVEDTQQPMQDAAQQTMQVLPDAATAAVDTTIQNISSRASDAANAGSEVGQAIIDGMRKAIEDGAQSIADAAVKVVEDALKAAQDAASSAGGDSGGKKKKSKKGSDSGDSEAKALGGFLTDGIWTLVGEYGPELINPDGYVYTAAQTRDMMQRGAFGTLERFAKGGQSSTKKSSSKSSKKKSGSGKEKGDTGSDTPETPKKQQTPEYKEELDLQQKILEITQQRDKVLANMAPIQEQITNLNRQIELIQKGSLEDQLKVNANKKASMELDQQIYHLEYDSNSMWTSTFDIRNKLRDVQAQQQAIQKGSLADQYKLNGLEQQRLQNESNIAQLQVNAAPLREKQAALQSQIDTILKGTLEDQLKSNDLQSQKNIHLLEENRLQLESAPLRQQVAEQQALVNKLQQGSIEDQKTLAAIEVQRAQINVQIANEQQAMVPIQNQIADLEAQIANTTAGTAEQRAIINANARAGLELDKQALAQQQALIPIQEQIRKTQAAIDAINKGSLDDQYAAVDLATEKAKIQLQEIDINNKLRNVDKGTLKLSQAEINALQVQLEQLDNQKANLDDQSQIKELNAQIASADAQKQLIGLQAQADAHQSILDSISSQKDVLQNQNDIITNQNDIANQGNKEQLDALNQQLTAHQQTVDKLNAQTGVLDAQAGVINANNQVEVAGAQAKLTDMQTQLQVYDDQISKIEAQNSVLDLQMQNIQLQNQVRADALNAQNIILQNQLKTYDDQIAAIQNQNNTIQAQSTLITANNATAAAGLNNEIALLQTVLGQRDAAIQKLNDEKTKIDAQTTAIQTQGQIAAANAQAQLIQLQSQLTEQETISIQLNAQLGTLNAQKKIYEDIRNLADAIANRPPNAQPAPSTGGQPTGGPPGTVVATATKEGSQTLYLSRGTGTDGWYTSSGQLVVQGGSANPPGGYKVKWMAAGGLQRAGELAIIGEEGPELTVSARDRVVFPTETTARIARAFGAHGAVSGGDTEQRNITVNVEYHRHGSTDYGPASLERVVTEAVNVALRS